MKEDAGRFQRTTSLYYDMNIIYLTINNMENLEGTNIHSGLIKEFILHGHHVTIISPIQKRQNASDTVIHGNGYDIYKPHIGNISKTRFIEKGLSVLTVGKRINTYLKKNLPDKQVDLLVLTVPPVTYDEVIKYFKKRYNCKVYLLIKDFWPASLFDLSISGGNTLKRIACSYLRRHEVSLFKNSDFIGCMSEANVKYLVEHNDYISPSKVHVNPNVIAVKEYEEIDQQTRDAVRKKYGIPTDKVCFIYGGTLGVGQNVKHIAECLRACSDLDCHFVIAGQGVQYHYLEEYVEADHPSNFSLFKWLPQEDYELVVRSCDIGMVFLRYTAQTPNIPSRILTYMNYGLPIIYCVDPVTDIGTMIEKGGYGMGCLSNDPNAFRRKVIEMMNRTDLIEMGRNGRVCLENEHNPYVGYSIIASCLELDKHEGMEKTR